MRSSHRAMCSILKFCCRLLFVLLISCAVSIDVVVQASVNNIILIASAVLLTFKHFKTYVSKAPATSAAMFTAIDESQGSTVVEQPLSSWSQLPSSNAASEAIDWEHSLHPPELELLPDGPDTPYELIQIIKKSLQQWESEVPPSLQPNPKKDSSEYQEEHLHDSSSESDSSQTSGDENWSSILTSPTTDGETSSSSISCKSHELKPKASFLTPMLDRLTGKSSNFATATTSSSAQAKEEKKRVVTV